MTEANRAPNLLPTVVVLGVLLWIFAMTGGRQIFVNEILSEAYDGSDWVDGAIAAILFFQGIVILAFKGLAQRYTAEFCPFLIFTFLLFLRSGRAAFHLRYVLVALVAASTLINSLTTVSWLIGADMNVPAATRAKWNEFLGRTSRH